MPVIKRKLDSFIASMSMWGVGGGHVRSDYGRLELRGKRKKRLNAWFEAGAKHIDHDCMHGLF